MPSTNGLSNRIVAESPASSAPIRASLGKQDFAGQPSVLGVGKQSTTKPCGLVPRFSSVSVMSEVFCAVTSLGVNPSSVTVSRGLAGSETMPSASSGVHAWLWSSVLELEQAEHNAKKVRSLVVVSDLTAADRSREVAAALRTNVG